MLNSGFLQSKPARILTAVLVLQVAVVYGFTRSEVVPQNRPCPKSRSSLVPGQCSRRVWLSRKSRMSLRRTNC